MEELTITSAKFIKDSEGNISVVKATIDGKEMFVPYNSEGNRHSDALSKWVADGNTIEEAG